MLFTCVLIGLSSAPIFSASEDSPSSEVSSWLAPDLDSVKAKELAEEVYPTLSESTRAAYDVNDVYLLLNNYFKGSMYNSSNSTTSVFPLVRISGYLSEIYDAIFGNASGNNYFDGIHELLTFYDGSQYYSIAQLQGMTWGRVGDISSTLNLTNSYLSAISSQLSGTLDPWRDTGAYYHGAKSSTSGSALGWTTGLTEAYFGFQFNTNAYINNVPMCLRLFIPWHSWGGNADTSIILTDILARVGSNDISLKYNESNVFYEPVKNGTYVYLFGFQDIYNGSYPIYFKFAYSGTGSSELNGQLNGTSHYVPFNTDFYQQLKEAFYQQRLTDYTASSPKAQAEVASEPVIQDTLDGFTGNGSAAAKTSDTGSMKNMSGSIQSGLSTGASAGNATSVFSDTTFWSWFTQENSDQINNPYPAPVVNMNNRKSSGDDIVDFMSDHDQELSDILGGSKW